MRAIMINEKQYTLYWVTGTVAETSKNMETRVHGGGGGGYVHQGSGYTAPVSISSTTVVHDQIFLVDTEGVEHALKLQNWDISCRAGHEMTAFWVIEQGKSSGPYIVIINHTLRQRHFNDDALKTMFRYKLLHVLLIAGGAGLVLGRMMLGGFGAAIWVALISLLIGRVVWKKTWNKKLLNEFKGGVDEQGVNLIKA